MMIDARDRFEGALEAGVGLIQACMSWVDVCERAHSGKRTKPKEDELEETNSPRDYGEFSKPSGHKFQEETNRQQKDGWEVIARTKRPQARTQRRTGRNFAHLRHHNGQANSEAA
jgi:hypothetical protein